MAARQWCWRAGGALALLLSLFVARGMLAPSHCLMNGGKSCFDRHNVVRRPSFEYMQRDGVEDSSVDTTTVGSRDGNEGVRVVNNRYVSGFVKEGYERVLEKFQEHHVKGMEVGSSVFAFVNGEVVVNLSGGYHDYDGVKPFDNKSVVIVFSSTKMLTSLAIAILVDRGLLSYSQPIASYWPEFASNGKEHITVGDLMSHRSGLAAIHPPDALTAELMNDFDALGHFLAQQVPHGDGTHDDDGDAIGEEVEEGDVPHATRGKRNRITQYHAVTRGLYASQLCALVDPLHRNLRQFVHDEISMPLNISFQIGIPHHHISKDPHLDVDLDSTPLDVGKGNGNDHPTNHIVDHIHDNISPLHGIDRPKLFVQIFLRGLMPLSISERIFPDNPMFQLTHLERALFNSIMRTLPNTIWTLIKRWWSGVIACWTGDASHSSSEHWEPFQDIRDHNDGQSLTSRVFLSVPLGNELGVNVVRHPAWRYLEMPSSNGISNARGLATVANVFANEGGGLISRQTWAQAMHASKNELEGADQVIRVKRRLTQGGMGLFYERSDDDSLNQTVGWGGLGGSYIRWAVANDTRSLDDSKDREEWTALNPNRRVAFGYAMNLMGVRLEEPRGHALMREVMECSRDAVRREEEKKREALPEGLQQPSSS